ncbi:Hsp70 protein-domain-containing protein [Mycena rebaudengoi]|nr:Hsp70 protein-domain-containing protein [Mycena rebaudengoi]
MEAFIRPPFYLGAGIFEVKATNGDGQSELLFGESALVPILVQTGVQVGALLFSANHQGHPRPPYYTPPNHHDTRSSAKNKKGVYISHLYGTTSTPSLPQHKQLEIDSLFEGIDLYTSLTPARFEELCSELFRGILELVEKVLRDSKIDKSNIHEIVLVGGATRIPCISINREEVVAYGAAVLSGNMSKRTHNLLLIDIAPLSLGIETAGGMMTPLIKRGSLRGRAREDKGRQPACQVRAGGDATGAARHTSNRITITNDKRRLLQDEIKRMVDETQKYWAEDDVVVRVESKDGLESYAYGMCTTLNGGDLAGKLDTADETLRGRKGGYDDKKRELEATHHAKKLYNAGGASGTLDPGEGPSIEEVA